MKNKTPAVLLYFEDFLTGTQEMSNEEVGQYIRLLCYQNAKGHLSMDFINRVVPDVKDYVLSKFDRDEEGYYFNARMESEIERRVKYSDSRAKNRAKTPCVDDMNGTSVSHEKDMKNISKTYEKHMETVTETVNRNNNNNFFKKKMLKHPEWV